ncbi:MAG: hypothetical protein JSV66_08340 [Trueperaceae bacterium]|nr:MAG: hypothetical protein JSV66_08340 [Trueperaceae bacterium]
MQPQELLDALVTNIRQIAKTETIIGEPHQVGESTVIPVIRLNLGFGAGGGEGEGTDSKTNSGGKGTGGGGGGGIKIEPAAFIVSKGSDVSIMAAPGRRGALAEMFEHVPDLLEKVMSSKQAGEESAKEKGDV